MGTKDRIQYIYCLYTIVSLWNIILINSYLFMQLAENRVASPKCYQQSLLINLRNYLLSKLYNTSLAYTYLRTFYTYYPYNMLHPFAMPMNTRDKRGKRARESSEEVE